MSRVHESKRDVKRHPLIQQLYAARVKAGISQRDLAADIGGIVDNAVWRWETDGRTPNMYNLVAWANALGLEVALVDKPPAPRI